MFHFSIVLRTVKQSKKHLFVPKSFSILRARGWESSKDLDLKEELLVAAPKAGPLGQQACSAGFRPRG